MKRANPIKPRRRIGCLKVTGQAKASVSGHARWRCECKCGKKLIVRSDNLKVQKSCGCHTRPKGRNVKDERFGRLVAIKRLRAALPASILSTPG